eukprot:4801698-Prorocentrum_lima.AAC.1
MEVWEGVSALFAKTPALAPTPTTAQPWGTAANGQGSAQRTHAPTSARRRASIESAVVASL